MRLWRLVASNQSAENEDYETYPLSCRRISAAAFLLPLVDLQAAKPLNVLFFTADDMNYDSSGVCGGPIKDLTPNLDQLASEGLRFEFAYSTVAVCQAVRQTMQTGLYRVPEEFYDLTNDRCERAKLIGDLSRQAEIEAMRQELLALMRRTGDPFTEAFANREDKSLAAAVTTKLKEEYGRKPAPRGKSTE